MLTQVTRPRNHCDAARFEQFSKEQLDRELHIPRQVCLAGTLAKVRAGWIQIRIAKLWMIESVEKLCAKLQLGVFVERKVSNQREIAEPQRLTAKPGEMCRQRANIIGQTDSRIIALLRRIHYAVCLDGGVTKIKSTRVECSIDGAATDTCAQRRRITSEKYVAQIQWPATLHLPDPLHLPVAQKELTQSADPLTEVVFLLKRNLPDGTDDETM